MGNKPKRGGNPAKKASDALAKDRKILGELLAAVLWVDFANLMIKRSQGIGDTPRSMGFGRRMGLRKSPEAFKEWRNQIHQDQLRASRLTMKTKLPMAELMEHDVNFQDACSLTNTDATRRQYSKWLNEHGNARTTLRSSMNDVAYQKDQMVLDTTKRTIECKKTIEEYTPTIDLNADNDPEAMDDIIQAEKDELHDKLDKAEKASITAVQSVITFQDKRKRLLPLAR